VVAGDLDADDDDGSDLDEPFEELDFSDELDVSLELDPSELNAELDVAEPLVELLVDSRLSLR